MLLLFPFLLPLLLTAHAASNDPLPATLELLALHARTYTPAGCVLASGNFTTDTTACFPFRAFSAAAVTNASTLTVLGSGCGTDGVLSCPSADGETGVFSGRAGLLAVYTGNTETRFSVEMLTGGGLSNVGLPLGVPLVIGSSAAIKLVLQVKAVNG